MFPFYIFKNLALYKKPWNFFLVNFFEELCELYLGFPYKLNLIQFQQDKKNSLRKKKEVLVYYWKFTVFYRFILIVKVGKRFGIRIIDSIHNGCFLIFYK